jgi:tetratricopeptide (TPR) repeat protein
MAIRGSLKEASVPDVLQLLALGQKTGCLSIIDRSNIAHVYFDRGNICYASIVNRRDRLGDILVKSGKISQEQLDRAIQAQARRRDKRLGELLIEQGSITREDLEHFMRVQIEEAVYFLFTWTQGTFNFEADVVPEQQDMLLSINPQSLLLEGARRVDEWSLIAKKIPSLNLVFTVDWDRLRTALEELTDEQKRIVPLLDGRRDVARVIEDSGLGEFEVGKALYGLITAGLAHRTGKSQDRTAGGTVESRVEEHRNLGMAFYRTGMLDEAVREFKWVAQLSPADGEAHFYLGLVALRQARWQEAVEHFAEALSRSGPSVAVLYNLALSYEQAGQFEEAIRAYRRAAEAAPQDPRVLTGWGVAALRRGDYAEAVEALDRACRAAGEARMSALWYWARSLAAGATGSLERAESLLREGLRHYPEEVILRNNLGALLELRDDTEQAAEILQAALSDQPSLPQLSKNLGDLYYRMGRYDEAWEAYQRAVKLDPHLGDDVYFKLGNIAHRRLDRELAAAMWKKALELNPGHEMARTNLERIGSRG